MTMTSGEADLISILRSVLDDAAQQLGVPVADLDVEHVESRDWRDGCLECARPGEACTDAIVPGFLIVVAGGGRRLDYHTDRQSDRRTCDAIQVGLAQSGGVVQPVIVDIDFGDAEKLSRQDAHELRALVDVAVEVGRFFEVPSSPPSHPNIPSTSLRLKTHGEEHTVTGTEELPNALRSLAEWLAAGAALPSA